MLLILLPANKQKFDNITGKSSTLDLEQTAYNEKICSDILSHECLWNSDKEHMAKIAKLSLLPLSYLA